MNLENINLKETGSFSPFFIDYINGKDTLKPFYGLPPEIGNFQKQINQKEFSKSNREVLASVLSQQYEGLGISDEVKNNINSLKNDGTFTITTGHQLNICTGPVYFLYKIVTVINICKKLKQQYPKNDFVPVYWMATEDHDLEEINHFFLFGEKVEWNTDQTGPVGRMDPRSMDSVFEKLPEKGEFFREAYQNSETLADAVRLYVNELFGDQGLVVIDADNAQLKSLFKEVVKDDVLNHNANRLVEETSAKLNGMGYKTQVFPREINFFYLENGHRDRIVEKDGNFKVNGRGINFSQDEISDLIETNPEKFSPNVILRPLYQEIILPNLAYIGGPAEVIYWLQLKPVFDHYKTPFPILMPRNFALIIPRHVMRKVNKVGVSIDRFFQPLDQIKKNFIVENTDKEIHVTEEIKHIKVIFDTVREKATEVDKTLNGYVGAEESKTLKSLENIEKRIKKSEERNQEVAIKQIENVKGKLFPNGNLQERHDNFLNFYVNNPDFINQLLDSFDPFSYTFHVMKEAEVEEATPAG